MDETSANDQLQEKLKKIRLIVFDVDGTLTDGTIYLEKDGDENKGFSIVDGLGFVFLRQAGIDTALITGRKSSYVEMRAKQLRIPNVLQGIIKKAEAIRKLAAELGIEKNEIAAMGDDLLDLELFGFCGVKLAVAGGAPELIAEADWVSTRPGGHGAARDAIEVILKAQGKWEAAVNQFRK